MQPPGLRMGRRTVLAGFGGLGAAGLLAACSSGGDDPEPTPSPARPSATTPPTTEATGAPTPTPQLPDGLDVMIGQMIMLGFRGTELVPGSAIAENLEEHHIGAVVLFDYDVAAAEQGRNITAPEQVTALCAALQAAAGATPLLISTHQEGGEVQRLGPQNGFPALPSAAEIGLADDIGSAGAIAEATAATLSGVGINWNLAPVVDLNLNTANPIIGALDRSFSGNAGVVTRMAQAMVLGHRAGGVLTTLKHFPGHGSSAADSHLGVVDVTDTWSDIELAPYRGLISAGQADTVTVGHLFNATLDAEYPATLSHATVTGLLRDELGFQGVVVTDDLGMGAITSEFGFEDAIRLAILAGNDILAFANSLTYDAALGSRVHAAIRDMVVAGTIPLARIEESSARVTALKAGLG